jgi:adenine-specific DNA-methyltransferase
LEQIADYLLWYAKSADSLKYRQLFLTKDNEGDFNYRYYEDEHGIRHEMTREQLENRALVPSGSRVFTLKSLEPSGNMESGKYSFEYQGRTYPHPENGWATPPEGMEKLRSARRLMAAGTYLRYVLFEDDYPVTPLTNPWHDTSWSGFGDQKLYVVQTNSQIVRRCMLMATDPGDLVLDPTCGSGTTAYVAEQWGRRWITIDTSRVPLALARQRLITATFPWYKLRDDNSGPSNGFIYARRQNRKGEEVGGIVPHVTLKSIANNESPSEEVLLDRPEVDGSIVRISGPLVVEATLPTPQQLTAETGPTPPSDEPSDHVARMIEVLRRSPTIALPGNRKVTLKSIRRPGRSLSLSAEAQVDLDASGGAVPLAAAIDAAHESNTGGLPFSSLAVAILFGPADGPVTAKAVLDAAKEANVKGYRHLYVIGFAITPDARADIDAGEDVLGLPATFVAATMDLQMGDLLKNQRSSQIFSVCGAPDIVVIRLDEAAEDGTPRWQVKLLGLDVFDPITMEPHHAAGDDVPCWMLDTAYNGMVFHADQVFFPKTSAWDSLRKALRATHDEAVWAHLAGDTSAPFAAAVGGDIAVKVIDERGNELPVIRRLVASSA